MQVTESFVYSWGLSALCDLENLYCLQRYRGFSFTRISINTLPLGSVQNGIGEELKTYILHTLPLKNRVHMNLYQMAVFPCAALQCIGGQKSSTIIWNHATVYLHWSDWDWIKTTSATASKTWTLQFCYRLSRWLWIGRWYHTISDLMLKLQSEKDIQQGTMLLKLNFDICETIDSGCDRMLALLDEVLRLTL